MEEDIIVVIGIASLVFSIILIVKFSQACKDIARIANTIAPKWRMQQVQQEHLQYIRQQRAFEAQKQNGGINNTPKM